jgi:hypothetical protein
VPALVFSFASQLSGALDIQPFLMKYRPSRLFVICLASLALTGAASGWAWKRANATPSHVRATSTFFELLFYKEKPQFRHPTDAERASSRQAVRALMAELVAEFPELHIHDRPVPGESNGYLQLHLLSPPPSYPMLPLSEEFLDLLAGRTPWAADLAARLLGDHAETVETVVRIAAMEDRSSAGMPDSYVGFVSGRAMKAASQILLTNARLAAETGDEGEALRQVALAQNLASHLHQLESPTLLSQTLVIMMELNIQSEMMNHLLPALGPGADLARWISASHNRSYDGPSYARVMRGEWHAAMEFYLFPVLINKGHPDHPPDATKLARLLGSTFAHRISQIEQMSLADLLDSGDLRPSGGLDKLSTESREIIDIFYVGSAAWSRGYVRSASVIAANRAAMELLELENDGETLSAETLSRVTRDPLTGQPFEFDPDSRTVSLTVERDELKFDPVKLPW